MKKLIDARGFSKIEYIAKKQFFTLLSVVLGTKVKGLCVHAMGVLQATDTVVLERYIKLFEQHSWHFSFCFLGIVVRIISKESEANNNGENNRLDLDLETENYWGVIIQVLKRDGRQWVGRWRLLFWGKFVWFNLSTSFSWWKQWHYFEEDPMLLLKRSCLFTLLWVEQFF